MAKKTKTPTKSELEAMGKKELRALCGALGIEWSKTDHDEDDLRGLIADHEAEEAHGEVEEEDEEKAKPSGKDAAERPAWPKGAEKPDDCYGWLFDPESSVCTTDCPNRKGCQPLAEKAAKLIIKIEAELDAEGDGGEEKVKAEMRKEHTKLKAGGQNIKPKKEDEEAPEGADDEEEKPTKKKAKAEGADENEPEDDEQEDEEAKPKGKKAKAEADDEVEGVEPEEDGEEAPTYDDETIFKVLMDEEEVTEWAPNANWVRLGKSLIATAKQKSTNSTVTGKQILKICSVVYGVTDEEELSLLFLKKVERAVKGELLRAK